jgi:hypothetical protein
MPIFTKIMEFLFMILESPDFDNATPKMNFTSLELSIWK